MGASCPGPHSRRITHKPCQTSQVAGKADESIAAVVTRELVVCRLRGIERLDLDTHNQKPKPTPQLDALANEYMVGAGRQGQGRVAKLKSLLRDATEAFAVTDREDSALINALLFGDSPDRVAQSAGELLDKARRESGFDSEARFRQVMHSAFANFAHFVPKFVAESRADDSGGTRDPVPGDADLPLNSSGTMSGLELERHAAVTGYIGDGEQFINLLAQAVNITIVGLTNETLGPMLMAALKRKRADTPTPDGTWGFIRIVFLDEALVNPAVGEQGNPNLDDAQHRRRAAVHGRQAVGFFLRGLPDTRWATYDLPEYPPFTGTLFELPNGKRVIHLIVRRLRGGTPDQLFLQVEETRDNYFSQAFEEIVRGSIDANKPITVGRPDGGRFKVRSPRPRHELLRDGSLKTGWLASILVVTWRIQDGRIEQLWQFRTQRNATRELNTFTHLAGYITQDYLPRSVTEFGLGDETPLSAARHRIELEADEGEPGELEPVGTCSYLHPDKEHLFFFVYGCQLPEDFQFWPQAGMHDMAVERLMAIRNNQVLVKALTLCESPPIHRRARIDAMEIVASNLVLHDHADVAQELRLAARSRSAVPSGLRTHIRDLESRTRQTLSTFEVEVPIRGLSGLQFREFFTTILPYYKRLGVPGAMEQLAHVDSDNAKRKAVTRLSELYHHEALMRAVPYEL